MGAFEQYFTALQGKKIAVFGLGVSNRPLVRLLLEFGCNVIGCDRTPREKLDQEVLDLERAGCALSVGENYLDNLSADVVFRTPGMHPANPGLEALRQKGAAVTSEMEAFFEVCPCHILAVTGSDGKTTTTTLVSEMLKASGKTVWLGGNIGTPQSDDRFGRGLRLRGNGASRLLSFRTTLQLTYEMISTLRKWLYRHHNSMDDNKVATQCEHAPLRLLPLSRD